MGCSPHVTDKRVRYGRGDHELCDLIFISIANKKASSRHISRESDL